MVLEIFLYWNVCEKNYFFKDVFMFLLLYVKIIDNYLNIKDNFLNVLVLYNFNIKVYFYEFLFKNVVNVVKDFYESCDFLVFDVFKCI